MGERNLSTRNLWEDVFAVQFPPLTHPVRKQFVLLNKLHLFPSQKDIG